MSFDGKRISGVIDKCNVVLNGFSSLIMVYTLPISFRKSATYVS